MILHYLKSGIKLLSRNKIFSFISIGGLIIALSCSFLILLFVLNETSMDKFHKNKNDIYRIFIWGENDANELIAYNYTSFILAEAIPELFPEIIDITRIYSYDHFYGGQYIIRNEETIKAPNFHIVDQSFFDIFSFKVKYGDRKNLIQDINSLVLTESMSNKYFPNENPVGQILRIQNLQGVRSYRITGVIEDFPSNSTLQASFLGNIELASDHIREREWGISATRTFVQLQEGSDPNKLKEKLNLFAKEHHKEKKYTYDLQCIEDMYFHSDFFKYYRDVQGNSKTIIIYSIIGILILLVASINYVIITTAKSSERMVEIGMRKVLGASRNIIFKQIIVESVIFTLFAFPFALILSEFTLPLFSELLGKKIDLNYFSNLPYLFGILFTTFIIGIISGSYISVFISNFNPDQIFKKRFIKSTSKFSLRKILIVSQVVTFMVLFIFSLTIILQIKYMTSKSPGFEVESLISVYPPHDHDLFTCKPFVDQINTNPNIESASEVLCGLFTPASYFERFSTIKNSENNTEFNMLVTDDSYIETMKIQLLEGRNFSKNLKSDTSSIIINKTAAKSLGLENPINNVIFNEQGNRYTIIGLIDDFHFKSIHSKIAPIGIYLKKDNSVVTQIMVRVNLNNIQKTLGYIEQSWITHGPGSNFEYEFLENQIVNQYTSDKNFAETIKWLTILTILIASAGMFGFSYYNTKQKTKEIGIRKVFGANSKRILELISKELGILIFIATVVSWPVATYVANKWLQGYAYHISLNIWFFLVSLFLSVLLVFITSGIVAYKASIQNPVDSLRYE
jgi:putative ABC transport system permease protein